jgi:anti-sigma factor RsiW
MICAETRRLLDAYVDNELDVRGALEVEEHLERCPTCGAEEQGIRELQGFASANLTRYVPPQEFTDRVRAALRAEAASDAAREVQNAPAAPPAARPVRRARRWAAAIAPLAAVAALVVFLGPHLSPEASHSGAADAIVDAHVRSLLANHLTDVASSDQHTVKPWFQGKLDYSVPVTDWASEGFPLLGGRLDYLEETPAAALVYKRAQHVVNLFVWPNKGGDDGRLQEFSRRGYHAYRWTKNGMNYWAVSEVNDADLRRFVQLVRGDH